MHSKLTIGQSVRFNKRCVLAPNVPRNSQGYQFAALVSGEDDKYTGAGVIEVGTLGVVLDYASHGTGADDAPIVRVKGRLARVHLAHLDPA